MAPISIDFTGIVKFSMNTSKKNNYCIVTFIYIFIIQYVLAFSETHVIIEVKAAEKTIFQRMTAGHLIETAVYAKIFGKLHNIGRENNVEGRIHLLPTNCDKDEQSFARLPGGWVAVLNYTGKPETSRENGNVKECQGVVERMKKVLIFGASAIIILTLNNQILEQLDIGQLFSKPVVLIDTVENISAILQFLTSKMKLRAKFTFHITNVIQESQKSFTTVTLWGTCGRYSGQSYHEWDGVVCLGQPHSLTYRDGKVDPENFWNYFYTGILLLLMIHYIRTRRGHDWENPDYIDAGLSQLAYKALAVMKIQRYSKDGRIDTCAICLEKFFTKQKLRVLPCRHYFHTKCVDPWLVRSHTCPLCKLNIIETLECHPAEN